MSQTMQAQIRHLQERLAKAEAENELLREALRPFAKAYVGRTEVVGGPSFIGHEIRFGDLTPEHFARAAEIVAEQET